MKKLGKLTKVNGHYVKTGDTQQTKAINQLINGSYVMPLIDLGDDIEDYYDDDEEMYDVTTIMNNLGYNDLSKLPFAAIIKLGEISFPFFWSVETHGTATLVQNNSSGSIDYIVNKFYLHALIDEDFAYYSFIYDYENNKIWLKFNLPFNGEISPLSELLNGTSNSASNEPSLLSD